MEIRYTNTLGDLVRFNLYHLSRMGVVQVLIVVLVGIHVSTFGVDILELDQPLAIRIASFVLSLAILFGVLVALELLVLFLSYKPAKNRSILTDHVLRITDDGIVEETPLSSSTVAWSAIPRIAQNSRYLFVYVQQNSAHVVPKRAFPSSADATAFYETVEKRIERK